MRLMMRTKNMHFSEARPLFEKALMFFVGKETGSSASDPMQHVMDLIDLMRTDRRLYRAVGIKIVPEHEAGRSGISHLLQISDYTHGKLSLLVRMDNTAVFLLGKDFGGSYSQLHARYAVLYSRLAVFLDFGKVWRKPMEKMEDESDDVLIEARDYLPALQAWESMKYIEAISKRIDSMQAKPPFIPPL